MKRIVAEIDGMMCGMCESHVSDAIRRAFAVKKVSASHKKGVAVIETESGITEAALRAALVPTGYRVLSVREEAPQEKGLFARLFGK